MNQTIAISKLKSIFIESKSNESNDFLALRLNAKLMEFGYLLSEEAIKVISSLNSEQFKTLYDDVISSVQFITGNINVEPFYPNFPSQVKKASDCELFMNAICHYFSQGEWLPSFKKEIRDVDFENIKFKQLNVVYQEDMQKLLKDIVTSNNSISDQDKDYVNYLFYNFPVKIMDIPFKENRAMYMNLLFKNNKEYKHLITSLTDILRLITAISNGDVSLSSNTKFKSLKRENRREIAKLINQFINEDELKKHYKKWNKIFHMLHIREYNYEKINFLLDKKKLVSFNTKTERLLENKDVLVLSHLENKPSELGRRLGLLLSLFPALTIKSFRKVIKDIPTKTLVEIWGGIKNRDREINKRVVFPKGDSNKLIIIDKKLPVISEEYIKKCTSLIKKELKNRFGKLPKLGNVFISDNMYKCNIPSGMRAASSGAYQVAKGTRLPLDINKTLRLFVYWVGKDIDLSAGLHDENFNLISSISYTNLREYDSFHSGDITDAVNGASEYIDLNLDILKQNNIRYVSMNVFVYNGPTFSKHSEVYAGWMEREHPNSNEIYEPSTVQRKFNIKINGKSSLPCVFDLEKEEVIWLDINPNRLTLLNNIENNKDILEEIMEAMVELSPKISLGELLDLHVKARGKKVKRNFDIKCDYEGDITPFDLEKINGELLS